MKNTSFRWVIRVLALCLVLLAIPSVQALEAYSGTPETPTKITASTYAALGLTSENWNQYNGYYGIRNAEELYGFAKLANNENRFAKAVLLQDIVVNETVSASGAAHTWTPIGTSSSNYFNGAFDGNGHTISGLYYNDPNAQYVGLFGYVGFDATNISISNVTLANSYLRGKDHVGGIAGFLLGENVHISGCKIAEDVTVCATTTDNEAFLGGIFGGLGPKTVGQSYIRTVQNCVVLGSVVREKAGDYAGAVVGEYPALDAKTIIKVENCYYRTGCLTINNEAKNFGNGSLANHTNDTGCTQLASASAAHDCLSVSSAETKANCTYPGRSAHSFCLICGRVTSGTRTVTPESPTAHVYSPSDCLTDGICQVCGDNKGKDPDNHHSSEYTYLPSATDPKKHDIFHKCCNAPTGATGDHQYEGFVCKLCGASCPHDSFTGNVCNDCGLTGDPYIYYEWDGSQLTQKQGLAPASAYNGALVLNSGWYIVKGNKTVDSRIMISGDVHLILANGAHLDVEEGIALHKGNSLHIYAQSTSLATAGRLTAQASVNAGIGGSVFHPNGSSLPSLDIDAGDLTIHGGIISAMSNSAGIGASLGVYGPNGSGGSVIIFGGQVTAKGGNEYTAAAGIGSAGGSGTKAGKVTVRGGTVKAEGSNKATGIGSAYKEGAGADVVITGGSVWAIAGDSSMKPIGGSERTPDAYTLKNAADGDDLSLYTLVLDGAAASEQVTAIDGTAAACYGISDVYTQEGGKLYFYLPTGSDIASAVSGITAGGKIYYYSETNESGEHQYTLHLHSWSYAGSDSDSDGVNDTITATCTSCTLGRCSVTISAPASLTYDGSSKDAVLTYDSWALGESGKPSVAYNAVSRTDVTGSAITASITLGDKSVSISYAITKAAIDSIALDVAAPVGGAAPQADIAGLAGCSGSIVWTPSHAAFDYNTEYTASVTLAPDGNHEFTSAPAVADWTGTLNADGSAVYTRSFSSAKRKIVSVSPPAVSQLSAYHADEAGAIAALPQSLAIVLEADGSDSLPLAWAVEGTYDPTPSASNTFLWTAANTAYDENGCALTGTVFVANADPLPVVNTAKDASHTYDGQPFDVSALFTPDENAGAPTYEIISGGTADGTLSAGMLTINKTGTFSIQMTTAAHGGYAAGAAVTATLTVSKGDPVSQSDVPTGLTAWYSQTLADVDLNAQPHPRGTWAWADDTLSVGNATGNAFPVVFTPHDDDLWNTVTGLTASVAVSAADTGLAVSPQDATHIYGDAFNVSVSVTALQPTQRRGLLGARTVPAPGSVSIAHGGKLWQQPAANGSTLTFPFGTVADGFLPGSYTLPVVFTTDGNMNASTAELRFTVAYLTADKNGDPIPDAKVSDPSLGEWYREAPTLTAPNGYQVSTENGPDASWGPSAALTPVEGENEYTYYLKDEDGRIAEKKVTLKADLTAPSVSQPTVTPTDTTAEISAIAEDENSGVASIALTATDSSVSITDNGNGSFSLTGLTPGKDYTLTLTVKDNAGNQTVLPVSVQTLPAVRITAPLTPTSVSAVTGQSVTISITAENASAFQWYRSTDGGATFTIIADANTPELDLSPAQLIHSGHQFFCRAYGPSGVHFADSPVFTLTVADPVVIPQTGDKSDPLLWALCLAVSLCAFTLLFRRRKGA